MKEIIVEIFGEGQIPGMVRDVSDLMVTVASGMVITFFLIRLGWTYVSALRSNATIDLGKVVMSSLLGMVIIFLLQVYTPVVGVVDSIMMGLIKSIQANVDYEKYDEFLKKVNDQGTALSSGVAIGDQDSISDSGIENAWGIFSGFDTSNIYGFLKRLFIGLLQIIIEVIGSVIALVAYMNIAFFKIIGPIAIVFSLVPFLQGHLGKWFGALLGGYSTLAALSILEGFFGIMAGVLIDSETGSSSSLIIVQLVIISMYVSAARLGSYIVGSDTVSDAIKSIQSNAQTAVKGAASGGTAAVASKAAALKAGASASKGLFNILPKPKE